MTAAASATTRLLPRAPSRAWAGPALVGLALLWVLVESVVRGSLWEAIRTTPAEDLRDLAGGSTAPAPVTASPVPIPPTS